MADRVELDIDGWHEHAQWWDRESPRVRKQFGVTPESLEQARSMFGRIGSSTVGAAFQELLQARAEAGHRLGGYCEGVAGQIRASLATYAEAEGANQQTLRT